MKLPAPNRIAVYATLVAALITALLPVVVDLGWSEVAQVLGGALMFVLATLKFLDGWQAMEKADYQAQLIERQRVAGIEVAQAEQDTIAAAQAVGKPGAQLKLKLPR